MLTTIVVSYNTRDLLRGCLSSVFDSMGRSDLQGEVWVVDNASSDGSPDMVRETFPDVRLIACADNVGFAAANNLALRELGLGSPAVEDPPHAVLLLNPDTVVRDDALARMFHTLMADEQIGVAGANLLFQDGSFQHGAFRFPDLFQVFFDFFPVNHRLTDSRFNGRYPRALYERAEPFPIDHPLGAAMMARWDAVERIGPMDERFFMYCEEIDWCMRFKEDGWRIVCVPRSRVVHYAGQSTAQFRDRMFVALWRSRFLLFRKHYSSTFRRAARFLVSVGLKHKVRLARDAVSRGEMEPGELEKLEAARDEIMELPDR